MKKSTARRALEAALAEATNPVDRATIADRLSRLAERESRTTARRHRIQRARAAKQPAPKPWDGDEPFELAPPAPAVLTQPNPPTRPAPAPESPAALPTPAPIPLRVDSGTYTSECAEPVVWWDTQLGGFVGRAPDGAIVRAVMPTAPTYSPTLESEFERTGRLMWSGGRFEDPEAEKQAAEAADREFARKMGYR